MESSSSKADVIRPVLLKAGIPLALSVAGYIFARIISRRRILHDDSSSMENTTTQVSSLETDDSHKEFGDDDSFRNFKSASVPVREDEEQIITNTHFINFVENSETQTGFDYEENISGLRNRIEELQKKQCEMEIQFLQYCVLKEQESVLVDLKNMLLREMAYVNFLDKEISLMEEESKRFKDLVVEYLGVLEQLETWKSKNGLLQRKVNKLLRKTKCQSKVIRQKNVMIEAREAEILRSHDALESTNAVVRTLEDEFRELQSIVDHLQVEKNELLKKLNSVEDCAPSIPEIQADGMTMEDYKQLVNELEQLRKDRAAELSELIHLRWSNACLRHELMRNYAQQEEIHDKKAYLELEFEGNGKLAECRIEHQLDSLVLEPGESSSPATTGGSHDHHPCSKRRKLLQKLKKWVDGSEKMRSKLDDKERHEVKCFGRLSVSDEAEEENHVNGSKSCSSA